MQNLFISFGYENPLRQRFGADFFKRIPDVPGVYFMLGERGEILYIGKAKNLRARLNQYAQAKPGSAAERTLEMIESIRRIEWKNLNSESRAIEYESELLHAIRPPFNIAQTEAEHYLYIGVRDAQMRSARKGLDFQLSSHPDLFQDGYEVFGCFKHRSKIKQGYVALLRLFHASLADSPRFAYPARVTRASPPWLYSSVFFPEWREDLDLFLGGASPALLGRIVQALLENENVPRFMRPSIQDDIETVQEFYRVGPLSTSKLKRKFGIRSRILSHEQMDRLIARDLSGDLPRGLPESLTGRMAERPERKRKRATKKSRGVPSRGNPRTKRQA